MRAFHFLLLFSLIDISFSRCTATLRVGSRGECVKVVQKAVGTSVDGIFGPNTKIKVMAFQQLHGLVADGIVGQATWNAIYGDQPASWSGAKAFDASIGMSETSLRCLADQGYKKPIFRIFRSNGKLDPVGLSNVRLADEALGVKSDVYIFPKATGGSSGADQIKETLNYISSDREKIDKIWLDIEIFNWSTDKKYNRQFIEGMISEMSKTDLQCNWGIYTSKNNWQNIVGLDYEISKDGSHPLLWYAHYDGIESFSDFSPFGGWTNPYMKQYAGDKTMCGMGVDLNIYKTDDSC